MKHLLTALTLAVLGACGDHPHHHSDPAPVQADLIVEAKNLDSFDYALWLEWQDETGTWNQTFLFAVYGDPHVGPTQDFGEAVVIPGIPYYVLLADVDGNLYDTQTVWLSAGSLVDLHYKIIGGYLVPAS
jgi:hypothetical protein